MQLICVSRGSLAGGTEFAKRLADNLGYRCVSREELTEAAIAEGIQVGRLETAMLKPGQFSERLSLERERYLAFTTAFLCRLALEGDLVYHGRQGHLVLPGIGNLLRARVVADHEYRVQAAIRQLGVGREKAQRYLEAVDQDRRRWAKAMYGVFWEDVAHYDFVLNLERLSAANAAQALTTLAQLPEFQLTPASRRALEERGKAARARLLLARDERTSGASFQTTCTNGTLTVTYLPQDRHLAQCVPEVVGALEGVTDVRATMASTNLVWVQESFDPDAEAFAEVVQVAAKWNAAVRLVRFSPGDEDCPQRVAPQEEALAPGAAEDREYNGGIEADLQEPDEPQECGLRSTVDALARLGQTGGGSVVHGGREQLLGEVQHCSPCTLVVVGELFHSKGEAVRTRLQRELRSFLADHLRTPVVLADELRDRYLFGGRDALRLAGFLALVAVLYTLVLGNQAAVLTLLHGEVWPHRLAASVAVFLFVPLVAHAWGTVAHTLLKLIRME